MNGSTFDLEERTLRYAGMVRVFVKKIPKTPANKPDSIQLIRASGSVGANYIETNEAVSREDFIYRAKVCRKEAKESPYWLKLIDVDGAVSLASERDALINESTELVRIFSSIIKKTEQNNVKC
ncbi:MAG: four helix bundle protein [Chitinispirillaceae bacterium]|nr:four helix bundle protein [Chitinispirillaceae bacterium]